MAEKVDEIRSKTVAARLNAFLKQDPLLQPYAGVCRRRVTKVHALQKRLTLNKISLCDFASGHEYYGLHFIDNQWVFREWAPNAVRIYMVGDMTGWQESEAFALERINAEGDWEIRLSAEQLRHTWLYRLKIHWPDGSGDRIPAYARRVVQDPESLIFNAQVWFPPHPYRWRWPDFRPSAEPLFIYEAHVGMAQEENKVGSYQEFTQNILPRIVRNGYNTIQLMAVPEHPYYGSFGYHVANFFAASSRFGTPEELKCLVDTAHGHGLAVIMDLVHSHAAGNVVEGLSCFDGTPYQYFHGGERGIHKAWDSRCFDYGKPGVVHFLLSNCRFWLDEYKIDGFRFDGVTSMLYHDHGLGKAFTSYDDYFGENVDEEALAYLTLANEMIHAVRPGAVTIAEDVSGMPGLAMPVSHCGAGFDYRFAMGIPDFWIRIIKEIPDEHWPMGHMWYELTNRRNDEKTISYAESHDQALVGDQTLIFRLIGADMYTHMQVRDQNLTVDRGIALHKMIRLLTLATAGNGYLNFMGNEFGHPEWIDFPRRENNWSYHYARRQWHLVEDSNLKYHFLGRFDHDMIMLARRRKLLTDPELRLICEHGEDKVLAFMRAGILLVFNFHPARSHADYGLMVPAGEYRMVLDSDTAEYGGHSRLSREQIHQTRYVGDASEDSMLRLYLPNRTAVVLQFRSRD